MSLVRIYNAVLFNDAICSYYGNSEVLCILSVSNGGIFCQNIKNARLQCSLSSFFICYMFFVGYIPAKDCESCGQPCDDVVRNMVIVNITGNV